MRLIHYFVNGKNYGVNREKAQEAAQEIGATVTYKYISL